MELASAMWEDRSRPTTDTRIGGAESCGTVAAPRFSDRAPLLDRIDKMGTEILSIL